MDCVITAGGQVDSDNPLYVYTQGKKKALLDMGGRTMLERVVDALQGSQFIDDIVVVGVEEDSGSRFKSPVNYLPEQGSLVDNVLAGVNWIRMHKPQATEIMISTADIPALTTRIIDDLVASCRPFDNAIYYSFVTKEVMEMRFPGSRRSYVSLKGAKVAGGDIVIVQADVTDERDDWSLLTNARKHSWQIARLVGLPTLLRFALRQLTLADIQEIGSNMLGRPVKILLSQYPELAMDVDKPYHVELLRAEFSAKLIRTRE